MGIIRSVRVAFKMMLEKIFARKCFFWIPPGDDVCNVFRAALRFRVVPRAIRHDIRRFDPVSLGAPSGTEIRKTSGHPPRCNPKAKRHKRNVRHVLKCDLLASNHWCRRGVLRYRCRRPLSNAYRCSFLKLFVEPLLMFWTKGLHLVLYVF